MIIAFAAEKGGVGKSTAAINTAVELTRLGHDVCLVDSDKQATVSSWIGHRNVAIDEGESIPEIASVMKLDDVKRTLKDLDERYDFVLVDCAGRDSREMRSALLAADVAISPLKCSQVDLETITKMNDIVSSVKDLNPKLRVFLLRNIASTNSKVKEAEAIRNVLEENFPDLPVLDSVIRDRKVYRDSFANGYGVAEDKKDKQAKKEFSAFIKEAIL